MRVVLDVNVLIAALLSPSGAPAEIVARWLGGEVELVVSDLLLTELARALGYSKLRPRVDPAAAEGFLAMLERHAHRAADAAPPQALHSPDPADDYLLALAARSHALLVTGDGHLLGLGNAAILAPRELLERLGA